MRGPVSFSPLSPAAKSARWEVCETVVRRRAGNSALNGLSTPLVQKWGWECDQGVFAIDQSRRHDWLHMPGRFNSSTTSPSAVRRVLRLQSLGTGGIKAVTLVLRPVVTLADLRTCTRCSFFLFYRPFACCAASDPAHLLVDNDTLSDNVLRVAGSPSASGTASFVQSLRPPALSSVSYAQGGMYLQRSSRPLHLTCSAYAETHHSRKPMRPSQRKSVTGSCARPLSARNRAWSDVSAKRAASTSLPASNGC